MKAGFRKDIFTLLIISIVLTISTCFCLCIEIFYPFSNLRGFDLFYGFLALCPMVFSGFEIYIATHLETFNPRKLFKIFGILIMPMMALALVASFLFAIIFPLNSLNWVFYLNISLLTVTIIYHIFLTNYVSNRLISEHEGYGVIRVACWAIILLLVHFLIFYVLGTIKIYSGVVTTIDPDDPKSVIGYLIFTVGEFALSFIFVLVLFYHGFASLITAKENKLVDLRHNIKFSLKVLNKYHIGFYLSCLGNLFVLIASIGSLMQFSKHHISLVALYATVLLMRLGMRIYSIIMEKKYINDKATLFKKKHHALYVSAIAIFSYTLFLALFGFVTVFEQGQKDQFALFIIFIPYAIIRLVIAFIKRRKSKMTGDPEHIVQYVASMMLAIFTFVNTFFFIGATYSSNPLIITAIVFAIISLFYGFGVAAYLGTVAYCGLIGKREKALENFIHTHRKEKDEIVEVIKEEKEKES